MAATSSNPLVSDRDAQFLLFELHDVGPRDVVELVLSQAQRFAREVLFPTYRMMDEAGARFDGKRVSVHPKLGAIYRQLVDGGFLTATRPEAVGGQALPLTLHTMTSIYLMAGNGGACAYMGLSLGAAHLIEAFGSDALRETYMKPMYDGRWTGTMALTEPGAGSSLADVRTRARKTESGHYLIDGDKIFISGGDQDFSENIVHLTLARIEGAPAGIKGVSLFAIPQKRVEGGALVDNDVHTTGLIHKIGWRAVPSISMSFGDRGDCHGFLVGEANRGISYMFQMMNEARLMVGANGSATASVAYHEALAYARTRTQGRKLGERDPQKPQVAIVEHADVRRMLLRQKAITEGSMALLISTAKFADDAQHETDAAKKSRAEGLLDLLTPVAKTFPAEKGFESNVLAVQVHGGYGYSSEYLPEAWMRDQKLNTIHEGTTGIQGLDLLGRKVVARGGEVFRAFAGEVAQAIEEAKAAGVETRIVELFAHAKSVVEETTLALAQMGLSGDIEAMLRHSTDYLDLFSTFVIGWQWLRMATVSTCALAKDHARDENFYRGKLAAAEYWAVTELPRIDALAKLCRDAERSYADMRDEYF